MSIRKTLLIAFVSVGLTSSVILTTLAFSNAQQALEAEIEHSLATQAVGLAEQVDKMMFERLQNAATWSRLDIMQDLQVRDVDKRLSKFLASLRSGYGDVYLSLSGIDPDGLVISSSDSGQVGSTAPTPSPATHTPLRTSMSGVAVGLALPADPAATDALMDTPLYAAFRPGVLGTLRLQVDWRQVLDVLDRSAGSDGRMIAMLDHDGRMIAASKALRERHLMTGSALASWQSLAGTVSVRSGSPLTSSRVIVGAASSMGYGQFAGYGWTTLVIQPVDEAFAPIHRMGLTFVALLILITLCTVLTAIWVSHRIAAPIVSLTDFARSYQHGKGLTEPPDGGSGEVGELSRAFSTMVREVTQSQQDLVRASKLAVAGEMSAVIAHEVRTPLGILRSSAQMLAREPLISDEGRELVGFIASETERLNGLVSTVLDIARPRSIQFVSSDAHELIRKAVAMLSAQSQHKQVTVTQHLHAARSQIDCDEEQVMQVLLNLLMNAMQILGRHGHIDIHTHDTDAALWIEVADDGPGVRPEDRQKVFDAFFFKREGGVGLGLAIVRQIVRAHEGTIEVVDSPSGGALFRIELPHTQTQPPGPT